MAPYGFLWSLMVPYGALWSRMVQNRLVWSFMVPYGPVWLPYGPVCSHMANIHQEGNFIRNMQMVSSNRVHSTHSCKAKECQIFKMFFCFSDKRCLMLIIKKKLKKINVRVCFFMLKIAFFWVLKMIIF